MILPLHIAPPPLYETEEGVVRIKGTRIPLERVIRAFLAGATVEQIVHDFDVLSIADVYAVVNYYLQHRDEVNAYLVTAEQEADAARRNILAASDPANVRSRLLARRSAAGE